MATPPGNSTPGASTRCTIRHLVDAVCKIRRQKQCATTARIHKAVRQQLQRNVEVEEVLEQLNAATSIGELWRVDNNGVTSYREPPKGTSKEHLKWAGEKHPTKWPTKDQSGGQFMMGHVKYPVNEHLTQPMTEHLTQRANEHVPWTMTDQLRCSTAEPLREHVMEPSRCSMNEAFMWPMAEPMRWPAMNDPMSWSAAEPLRQPTGELAQQRSAETPSWPMNEPFRRPMNESLAWSMNQSLRGPMAEPLAWHVTEPLRHPMADPLAWSVPEPLRRPMTEPLSWHGNDQLRRSIAEPLGWTVNNAEPFRRTAAEHFNWCAPDTVRQSVKEPYVKPVKDTSSTRNLNNISSGWPLRETTLAAHTSAKALSRSVMNSQKDSFKETSASTFACPVSQTLGVGTVTQNKTRSFSPSTRHANSKFHSNPPQLPVSCKNAQNPCAELQRTCKELPGMHEDLPRCDVQRIPEGSFLGVAQNPYLVSSQSMGEFAMMANNQGFCAPPGGQYGCPSNHTASMVSSEPGSLAMNRAPLQRTSEIAPEIPAIVPINDTCQKAGQQLESSCLRKCSGLPGKSNGSSDKTSSQSEKCLPSGTDTLRVNASIPGQVPDEVLKVARSLLEEAEPGGSLDTVESRTIGVESSSTFQDTQTTGSGGFSSSTPSVIENNNFTSLKVQNVLQPALSPMPCSLNVTKEQEPLFNSCGDALDTEAKLPSFGICLENCASGNSSAPSLESPAEENQHSASAQPATDLTGHLSDFKDAVTDNSGPESSSDQISYSEDKATGEDAATANDHVVMLNSPFLLDTQNPCKGPHLPQKPKCRRNLRKMWPLKRKKFNFGSLTFLISVVIRSTKACNAGKDVATTRSIKKLILSKYDVALQDLPLLSGRIRLACKRAVQSGRLQRKGHVYTLASSKIRKFSLFTKDACSRINKLGAKVLGGSTTKLPVCVESSNGSADGNSSRTLAASSRQCSLTDMHGLLESKEESPLRSPSVDQMGTANDPVQPPEGSSPTEDPDSAGCTLTATVSAQWEPNQGQAEDNPEKSGNTDENIESDSAEQSQYHGDMNPKGLIDGLTRFFTPSNKRSSRVSRNTLQRTLELKVKNGSSSPKARMLTLVPRGQQQQSRTKSVKAASGQAHSSGFFRLEKNKDIQHRRTSAGRRREQLYDGLSHFFAVDSKRRSCTLGRCHGSDLSLENIPFSGRNSLLYLGKKWDMSEKGSELGCEVKLSRLAGRVIRSRTRSLSLSGLKETKTSAQSKKQLSRHSPESKSLSHLNTCVTNALSADKRHSHTSIYSTRLSKQSRSDSSESLLCHDRSKSSGTSKTSTVSCSAVGRSTAAKGDPLLGDLVMKSENDVSTCDITHFKSSNVPCDAKNTSTHPPTSRQLDVVEHCKLSTTESQGTVVSSSSSTAFPATGKSAMVKLTRLSSSDCSLFLSHGGSCQSEPSSVMETKSLQNVESSGVKIEACVDPVSPTKEDQSTEHPTVLDAADARRIVRPGMTPNDMILFRKAQKIAAERILVSEELNNLDPCQPTPPHIQFGPYELTTAHSSLYPPEFARLPKLFICEFCLKYLKNHCALELHMTKCRQRYPPGNELYRLDNLSVFEVDGSASPIYCQNVCLLARLFLSSKSPMQYNMSPFLFYIATLNDDTGSHLVGYFAKEKYGSNGSYSLISLLVLPPYRRKGYGDFLIQLSYLICRLNKNHGSPLRPLSSVASLAFNANWSKTIMEFIKTYWTPEQALTIRDISLRTGIHPADVTSVLSSLQLIDGTKQDIGTALSLDAEIVEKCVSQWVLPYVNTRLRIDLKLLQGTKSSLQHLLKTSIESEKLSHIVTRKSARKIQRKRNEDDFVSVSGSETADSMKKTCERHVAGMCSCCSDFETKSRAAKRKNLSASPTSPSKSARLTSSDCAAWLSGKLSSSVEASETTDEKLEPPSSLASVAATISLSSDTSVKCHGVAAHFSTKSDAQEPDQKVTSSSQLVVSTTLTESASRDGGLETTEIVSKTEQPELKQVTEKKSTRSVAVQTDAYDSDFSEDDDDSSESSSGSSSCSSSSSCCSSTSSEESEVEETPAEAQVQNTKSEAKKSEDVLEAMVPKNEEHSENLLSVENELSISASSSSGTDARFSSSSSGDSSSLTGTIPESGPSSHPVAYCEDLYKEGADNSQKLESACEVLSRTFGSNGEFGSGRQNCKPQDPEGEDESSRQSLRDADLILCNTKPSSAADISHQLPEGANIQGDFAQAKVNTGTENLQGQLACCVKKVEVDPRDSYSGAAAVADSFQFGSSLSSGVPNIGMESPMSVNSCSEMSGCNMERAPSQAYSDCAQVQNVYSMENMGASPACGYGVNQSMTQMTSPTGSSQITSPVSNQSFNIASCSPAAGNGSGYGSAVESAIGGQLPGAAAGHMTGSGTTFKMPVEDTRYVAASSSYNVNGYGTAMASPASVGQCGYVGQYAEQSPGGQCAVINQNSPNGLGYTMPTPSPTNSSSRSFNMASPNTNAYHGQPSVPQAYDRSCPSAPVLSYARVLQQQLPGAADAVPWTHFYPPQATGYSLIKFPEQELVSQHAVALPRNLIPAAQPAVAVQQHLTQVNLVPLATKPAKCPVPPTSTQSKQHRRCGKSCKSNACNSSSLSAVRSQTVAPNVTIQPGTNMITSYNVINMNVDYRAQQPTIAAYPSGPYISNAALINDAQQMQSLNIYQHRAIDFPRQPRPHNNVYAATYGYINGAIAQQSFNIMRQQ